jgi:3-methylcrotonyl-CoA carboxylase beta subunit
MFRAPHSFRSSSLNLVHAPLLRDPTQHARLADAIEHQSTAYYGSARLWDDGIIAPTDTRDTLGLALAVVGRGDTKRTDGQENGFGVFRM